MKRYVMAGLGVIFLGVVSTVHAEMEVKVKDNTANNGFSIKEETTGRTIARFRGDGKVGIGTTNPLRTLTLEDSSYPLLSFGINGVEKGYIGWHSSLNRYQISTPGNLSITAGNAGGEQPNVLFINNSGNVGIGTTDPTNKIHIKQNDSGTTSILNLEQAGTGDSKLKYQLNSFGAWYTGIDNSDGDKFKIGTSETFDADVFMTIVHPSGNVGIGTTNPDTMLTVGNYTSSGRIFVKTSDIGLIVKSLNPQAPSNEAQILSGSLIKDTYAVGDKVSIVLGMTDLPGGLSSHIEAIAEDVNPSTRKCGLRILTTNYENDGVKERIRIAGNGNVGIDITNPAYKLDVNGTIRGSNVSPSDMRWKEHVKTLDNSLEKVNKLRGVSFEWKDKTKGAGTQVGLIAQDVEKVFPEVVSEDNEGYKSVAYDKLVGVLVESIKELKSENDALRQEIDSIKTFMSTHAQAVTVPASAQIR